MNTRPNAFSLTKPAHAIEWKLFVFLVLFMDVKLLVKAVAIVLAYCLQPNFWFGFKLRRSRLPLFYMLVMGIGVLNYFISRNTSTNYAVVTAMGLMFWGECILAIHQVKLFVDRTDVEILHNTLLAFFMLNILVSLFNLSAILMEIGFRNPFLYQGEYQKYFVSTGDHIKGLSFDNSTTNAFINCFGIIYFLYREKYLLVLTCMAILVITVSNITSAILVGIFLLLFLSRSVRDQKSIMLICMLMLVVFLAKISPQNDNYINEVISKYILKNRPGYNITGNAIPLRERPDSLLDHESRKEKTAVLYLDSIERERLASFAKKGNSVPPVWIHEPRRPIIPGDNIHSDSFQSKKDTTLFQRQLQVYMTGHGATPKNFEANAPGKLIAMLELFDFFKRNTGKLIAGNGIGNFSSKLAFRSTGLGMAGGFPKQYIYSHPDFVNNHLAVYSNFYTKTAGSHSIIHSPASVYGQIAGEYGLLGIASLCFFYIGFFIRHVKQLSYGLPLLLVISAAFLFDYWFEQLSIVLLFELMMFINIKENTARAETTT